MKQFSSYEGYKLNSLLTYYQQGFIAQLVEHHTGEASDLFWVSLATSIVARRITFTSILYLQCTHMIYVIFTSHSPTYDGYKLNSLLIYYQEGFSYRRQPSL